MGGLLFLSPSLPLNCIHRQICSSSTNLGGASVWGVYSICPLLCLNLNCGTLRDPMSKFKGVVVVVGWSTLLHVHLPLNCVHIQIHRHL